MKIAGQTLLTRLVEAGKLDQFSRKILIDRVMALDSAEVDINHINWVGLTMLSNQLGFAEIAEWSEQVVTQELVPIFH